MRKISPPECSPSELFDQCVQQISDASLRKRFQAQKTLIETSYQEYSQHSETQTWCELPRANHGDPAQVIVGDLTKSELVALYDEGMVGSKGDARRKYDEIKLLAKDECPYCGGCGEMVEEEGIGTLDHFMPKARFPVFSILPVNLVPACGVCNSGMGSQFPRDPNEQPLHPYFDAPHFYNEKWTTLNVSEEEPVTVSFGVSPPDAWSDKDKQRVHRHFTACRLRGRYRTRVSSDLSSVIDQRKTVHHNLSREEFRDILDSVANNQNLPVNGWRRTLYHGLARSDWFCSHAFN